MRRSPQPSTSTRPTFESARQLPLDLRELVGDVALVLDVRVDRADGVQHRRVVAAAEVAADLLQAVARVPAGQEHTDLPRERDALVPLLRLEV